MVHLPVYPENPYQPNLMEAQRQLGWHVTDGGGGGNFFRTALTGWKADILHLHWLHPYLLRDSRFGSWRRGTRFLMEIAALKIAGTRIVWTVHNLENHDQKHFDIELSLTSWFTKLCDLIFAHGTFAALAAQQKFGIPSQTKVLTVRHPNYCSDCYLQKTKSTARRELNLSPDSFIYCFLGRVQPYKQVLELVRGFREVARQNQLLIIAGKAATDEYARSVEDEIDNDPRIKFVNEYIAEERLQTYATASDIMVCPSRGILTSGSVILAMSLGRPAIAPNEGCIPEELGDAGFLYDDTETHGLGATLSRAFESRDKLEQMGHLARAHAEAASPQLIARQMTTAYELLLSPKTPQ